MRRQVLLALPAALALALSVSAVAGASPSTQASAVRNTHVCDRPAPGSAGCLAIRHDTVTAHGGRSPMRHRPVTARRRSARPTLWAPPSRGRTVAIVDAFDDPKAEADLGVYRKQFGLPACTTANGCFKKVNQTGGTTPPARRRRLGAGDLPRPRHGQRGLPGLQDPAGGGAPRVVHRPRQGRVNTRGEHRRGEGSQQQLRRHATPARSSAYNHPGIAITASTGDSGYGVQSPASYDSVIAVGGTSLRRASSARGWHETAWNGAGSGCSTLNAKPAWQTAATKCSGKASADVSAVADPNTGVAVYDSFAFQGVSGWLVFGGTSASSPIIASVYAMSGNTAGYPGGLHLGSTPAA